MNEKVNMVGVMVQERVQPLLDATYNRVQKMLKAGQRAKAKTEDRVNGSPNGNAGS